jgi:hypothetical protein
MSELEDPPQLRQLDQRGAQATYARELARMMLAVERLSSAVEQREWEYRAHRYAIDTIRAPHVLLVALIIAGVVGMIGGALGALIVRLLS